MDESVPSKTWLYQAKEVRQMRGPTKAKVKTYKTPDPIFFPNINTRNGGIYVDVERCQKIRSPYAELDIIELCYQLDVIWWSVQHNN